MVIPTLDAGPMSPRSSLSIGLFGADQREDRVRVLDDADARRCG